MVYDSDMKSVLRWIVLSVLLLCMPLWGAEFDIDKQIERIRNETNTQKRVEMMNELKRRLAQMNQEQRETAIEKLRARLQIPHTQRLHRQNILQQQPGYGDVDQKHIKMEKGGDMHSNVRNRISR